MATVIDSDQHLFESRTLWAQHIDPGRRDLALAIVDDELGYPWLTWGTERIGLAQVQRPGTTAELGHSLNRCRRRVPCDYDYDADLPADYWEPAARVDRLASMGLSGAVLFPNFGLLWERRLSSSLPALTANMSAWNRWCATVAEEGRGHLHPVAHLTLRDPDWLGRELASLDAGGIRLGMIAPAPVDGRPLSHSDHDPLWSAFIEHGVTPVFHVADQPHVIDDAFYPATQEAGVSTMESVFLWVPPAVAVTDLIVNGVLERHPELRIGIVELSSVWVPLYLGMLDGGWDFTSALDGGPPVDLALRPSEYFRRQVRVSSFSYERPGRLMEMSGDLFMCCSDYPHSEGTDSPLEDYAASKGPSPTSDASEGFYRDNVVSLLDA